MRLAYGLAAALIAASLPAVALAGNGQAAENAWRAADDCQRQAVRKFPDATASALAKRDAYVRKCLAAGKLVPRPGLGPGKPVPQKGGG